MKVKVNETGENVKKLFNLYDFKLKYNDDKKPYYYEVAKYSGIDQILIIPKYYLNEKIEVIGTSSFKDNQYIKTLVLSDAIRKIDDDAFVNTSHLVIYTPLSPNEVSFSNIKNVEIVYGLDEITEQNDIVFALLNDGTANVIGNNLDERKYDLFGRFGLTIEIPDIVCDHRVVRIENFAFANALNVKNYIFNKNIKSIGTSAFKNNEMLEGFYASENVIEIGDFALQNCFNLRLVEIPKSVKKLGYHLLEGVYKPMILFESDKINFNIDFNPESLELFTGYQSSISRENIHYALFKDQTAMIIGHSIYHKTDVIIPDNIDVDEIHYIVKRISSFSFYANKYIVNVTLPDTMTHIYNNAFAESGLFSVNLPKQLIHLGEAVFYDAINLKELVIPQGIKEVPRGLCNRCFSLVKVVLSSSVTKISDESFLEANQLQFINFPISIEEIGDSAFYNTALSYVEIGYSIKYIGDLAFAFCENLKILIILNEHVKLGERIIEGNEKMQIFIEGNDEANSSLMLMNQSKKKNRVFNEIYKVTEIEGVKYLITNFDTVFVVGYNPDFLEKDVIIVPKIGHSEVIKIIAFALKDATQMETLYIPETVIKIEDFFISGNSNLRKLTIPNHLNPLRLDQLGIVTDLTIEVYDDSIQRDLDELFDEINQYVNNKDCINPIEIREKFNLSHTQLNAMMNRLRGKTHD